MVDSGSFVHAINAEVKPLTTSWSHLLSTTDTLLLRPQVEVNSHSKDQYMLNAEPMDPRSPFHLAVCELRLRSSVSENGYDITTKCDLVDMEVLFSTWDLARG